MKPTTQYRIDTYCLIAFNALTSNLDLWRSKLNDKDVLRGVTRPYYDLVHALSIPSGYITLTALQKKQEDSKWPLCKDHCYSPQFMGRMIMDHSEIYLNEYDQFKKLFYIACTTVDITSEENRQLSLLTSNQKGDFKIYVPTDKKYQHLDIQLMKRNYGRNWYHKPTDSVSNYIETPQELLNYEKQFLTE